MLQGVCFHVQETTDRADKLSIFYMIRVNVDDWLVPTIAVQPEDEDEGLQYFLNSFLILNLILNIVTLLARYGFVRQFSFFKICDCCRGHIRSLSRLALARNTTTLVTKESQRRESLKTERHKDKQKGLEPKSQKQKSRMNPSLLRGN